MMQVKKLIQLIIKAGKLLTEGVFLKDCVLQVAYILCPVRRCDTAPTQWQNGFLSYQVTFMNSYRKKPEVYCLLCGT